MEDYRRFAEAICWVTFAGLAGALDLYLGTKWAIVSAAIIVGFLNITLCR